jgi:glycosyltransferase involved in cell wall biosynthesis
MPLPLVSIVVPCRIATPVHAELLDETLRTVDAQTVADYEVVVVDDGSPLDVSALVEAHRNTRLFRQANAGPAAARNTGIDRSRGEFLVFLDADDHLLAPALATGLAALADADSCGFTVGAHEEMTFEGAPVAWSVAPPPAGSGRIYLPLLGFDWYIIPPSCVMLRREVVDTIGGFQDPWGADDLDFYLRAAYRFDARCTAAPAVTRYRRYPSSASRDGERMLDSVRAVYERQRPLVAGDPAGQAAFDRGLAALVEIFRDGLVENVEHRLATGDRAGAERAAARLKTESPERWQAVLARLARPASARTAQGAALMTQSGEG